MRHKNETARKGSILDLFLIFLSLLCLVGVLLRGYALHNEETAESKEYTLTAVASSVDPLLVECIAVGDGLYTASGEYYGQILSVTSAPAKVTLLSGGTYYSGAWDESLRVDLTLEIRVSGRETGGTVRLDNSCAILTGSDITLYSERAVLRLLLYKITPTQP